MNVVSNPHETQYPVSIGRFLGPDICEIVPESLVKHFRDAGICSLDMVLQKKHKTLLS